MKNYFYTNELAGAVKELLDTHLPADTAKNIYIGDLSVLPAPERFANYLPAVVIRADRIDNTFANEQRRILYSPYSFTLSYICPYTFEDGGDAVPQGIQGAQEVANVLMTFGTPDGFAIAKSQFQCGGTVITSQVGAINFSSETGDIFRTGKTPMFIAEIEFCISFRTYAG